MAISSVSKGLTSKLQWQQVLHCLGVTSLPAALPAVAACPVCKGVRLHIFADALCGGQYHNCPDCRSSGDMLSLAAAAWKLSPQAAILKLQAEGCGLGPGDVSPQLLQAYLLHGEVRRQKLVQFTESIAVQLFRTETAGELLARHGLRAASKSKWLTEGRSRLLGHTSLQDAAKSLAGVPLLARAGLTTTSGRVLPHSLGRHALVATYYDRPQRPCAFQAWGEQQEQAFLPLYPGREGGLSEAGLAGHHAAFQTGGTVYMFEEALDAIRAQMRHLYTYSRPLPLLSWQYTDTARTDAAWDWLAGDKLCFWSGTPASSRLWWQLLRTDGWVYATESTSHIFSQHTPRDAIRLIEKRAVPWPIAMERFAERWDDSQLEELLLQLQAAGAELQPLFDRCHDRLSDRAARLLETVRRHTTATVNGKVVEQHADGWYHKSRTGMELICGAVLRVKEVITYPDGRHELSGEVCYEGRRWPFVAPQDAMQTNAAGWLSQFLLEHRAGLVRIHPDWKNQLLFLATAFCKPVVRSGYDRVGWRAVSREMVLPQFVLQSSSGQISRARLRGDLHELPGSSLSPPQPLLPHVLSPLTDPKPRNRLLWNLWVRMMYNVTAPIFGQPTLGIALPGEHVYRIARAVAAGIGCRLAGASRPLREILEEERSHNWPIFLTAEEFRPEGICELAAAPGSRNCLTRVTKAQAMVLELNGGWTANYSRPEANSVLGVELASAVQMLSGCFLQHLVQDLARNPLLTIRDPRGLAKYATAWLKQDWDLQVPEIQFSYPSTLFAWLVIELVVSGYLTLLPVSAWTGKICRAGAYGVLSWSQLQDVLRQLHVPCLKLESMSQVLPAGRPLPSSEIGGDYRLLITSPLIGKQARRLLTSRTPLRLYGSA